MQDEIFFLLKNPDDDCHDVIRMRDSNLRIKILCLNGSKYSEPTDKLVFYGNNKGEVLAFESADNQNNFYKILDAIRWYSQYIENPTMEILSHDPREDL
ncbi:MAG: hypothetical protein K0S09_2430 [Sphingobacteriaceae bacterium]|nr:hypothetical protein [Sphingobacteriaceae bacterium]